MGTIDRRGELVALLGIVVSVLGAVILAVLAIASESTSAAVWVAGFQMFGTAGIWLLTLIQLHQKRLVAEERLEVAELEQQRKEKLGGAQAIFDEEDLDRMGVLAMGRRLRWIERFLLPILALSVAAYHMAAGISMLPWLWQFPPVVEAGAGPVLESMRLAIFLGAIAFVSFMFSRYALGMSRLKAWGVLCAGGNFMFGCSVVCLAACISLFCASNDILAVEIWVARIAAGLLCVLAAETIINFILDFYRPRAPGEEPHPFYDSRLLGMFSEPGGILRSLADKIDYQFGFKVSETWFYRLMERAVLLLLLVQIAVILALTCIVVVPPGHQAVVEHWGRARTETAKPGIHLTWFWPIDRATIVPVGRVRRMELGHAPEEEETERRRRRTGPILWTKSHYKKEYQLLVADRSAALGGKVPANLLSVNMPVQWRVRESDADVIRFHSQAEDVAGIIESLAYRELTRYASHSDILDLLGEKGVAAAAALRHRLQAACDGAGSGGRGLGVEIVLVGIGGIHPPPNEEVAKTYEDVVSAMEKREARIKGAQGDAAAIRVASAGMGWKRVYDAIRAEDGARDSGAGELAARTEAAEALLRTEAGGMAGQMVAMASLQTLARVFREKSDAEQYAVQLAAYDAAPHAYRLRVYLKMLAEGLTKVRKYVILLDDPDRVIYDFDLKPSAPFSAIGEELGAMEAREEK